jgi:hypothetical protein
MKKFKIIFSAFVFLGVLAVLSIPVSTAKKIDQNIQLCIEGKAVDVNSQTFDLVACNGSYARDIQRNGAFVVEGGFYAICYQMDGSYTITPIAPCELQPQM